MVERVLVVEDHPDVGRVFGYMLQDRGYTVSLASSLEAARKCLEAGKFDLILCDFRVSDGTAIDFIEWLKSTNPSHPPIFCVSGYADEAKSLCLDAGFDGFLTKPVNLDELEQKLVARGLRVPRQAGDKQGAIKSC